MTTFPALSKQDPCSLSLHGVPHEHISRQGSNNNIEVVAASNPNPRELRPFDVFDLKVRLGEQFLREDSSQHPASPRSERVSSIQRVSRNLFLSPDRKEGFLSLENAGINESFSTASPPTPGEQTCTDTDSGNSRAR